MTFRLSSSACDRGSGAIWRFYSLKKSWKWRGLNDLPSILKFLRVGLTLSRCTSQSHFEDVNIDLALALQSLNECFSHFHIARD